MKEIKRVTSFINDGLGIFIHYGLYNKIECGEWFQDMYNLSSEEYYKKFENLKDVRLDIEIESIVAFAKENGFKYIVFTTKHHDGFCLFKNNNGINPDVFDTNTDEDLVKIFIETCDKYKIKPILYYATLDWYWDGKKIGFNDQLELIYEHIENLILNYPKFNGFWFDGNWSRKDEDWKEDRLYKMIRTHMPDALIINNSGLTNSGKEQNIEVDSITFEQAHLKQIDYKNFSRHLAAEACQTFNDHWGFARNDYNFKSLKDLINKFVNARSIKSNYLLNLSIDKNGKKIPLECETIRLFKKWVDNYGFPLLGNFKVIYNNFENNDFIINNNNKIYMYLSNIVSGGHVNEIKKGGNVLEKRIYKLEKESVVKKIVKATYLDNNENANLRIVDDTITLIPKSFDYGFNTIWRVVEVIVEV